MAEWGALHKVVEDKFDSLKGDNTQKAGRLAAASSWGQHNWESMERFYHCVTFLRPLNVNSFHF